jgi:hypothetical protein
MTLLVWHNLAEIARAACFRGSAWCALNLATLAGIAGVVGGVWSACRTLF